MYGQVWLTRIRLLHRKTNISMCESYFTFCKWNWITKFPFFYVPYITYRLLGYAQEWCNNDQNERFQDCRLDKVAILTGQKNHGSSCEMAYWLAAAVATFYTALGYWSETPGRIYPTLALDRKCIYLPAEGPSQTLRETKLHLKPFMSNEIPDSKVHGANMGPSWIMSVPDGPHVGPI